MVKNGDRFFFLPGLFLALCFFCNSFGSPGLFSPPTQESDAYTPVVVLELFTSQGCSSCPPADALLRRLKEEPSGKRLFPIAYHVDYWNYIGWADPFSREEYSRKQKEYAAKFLSGTIYTPQLVINGREGMVGSDARKIESRITYYSGMPATNSVTLTLKRNGASSVQLGYRIAGSLEGRQIRTVLVLDERTTSVQRGENRGRELINANIAIAESRESLQAEKGEIFLPIPGEVRPGETLHAIVITEKVNGDITGAARLTFEKSG